MTRIETNTDLYAEVMAILKRRKQSSQSLQHFLLRLWEIVSQRPSATPLCPDEFASMLDAAFEGTPQVDPAEFEKEDQPGWLLQLARQVVDLQQMAEAGSLADEMRFFGIDAPSGARWYNFDPHSYIECGLAGSFGGWTPAANEGRQLVPGPVAVMNADGSLGVANPEDIEEPVFKMQHISWDDFEEFLWAGQNYE